MQKCSASPHRKSYCSSTEKLPQVISSPILNSNFLILESGEKNDVGRGNQAPPRNSAYRNGYISYNACYTDTYRFTLPPKKNAHFRRYFLLCLVTRPTPGASSMVGLIPRFLLRTLPFWISQCHTLKHDNFAVTWIYRQQGIWETSVMAIKVLWDSYYTPMMQIRNTNMRTSYPIFLGQKLFCRAPY